MQALGDDAARVVIKYRSSLKADIILVCTSSLRVEVIVP